MNHARSASAAGGDTSRIASLRATGTKHRLLGLLCALLVSTSCSEEGRTLLQVGHHQLSIRIPGGWEHTGHGRRHTFENDLARISFEDLGPVGPTGLIHKAHEAHRLWENGHRSDARLRLARLPLRDTYLEDKEQFRSIVDAVYRAQDAIRQTAPAAGNEAFRDLFALLEDLPDPVVDDALDTAFRTWNHDERRDVAWRERVEIQGRHGLVLETWDRLSHRHRERHALVLNDGHVLSLSTEFVRADPDWTAFEELMQSIWFELPASGDEKGFATTTR